MNIRLQLFAKAQDLVGAREVTLSLAPDATVGDLRTTLGETYPALVPLLPHLLFAANGGYVSDAAPLIEGHEYAAFPPVSGG
ncbi:MAG: MoaD/ThiS family protein [Planctomycetaceae bacterium]|nr:MoaD/ThiS family protein [Planctomycetaceae bacterium]